MTVAEAPARVRGGSRLDAAPATEQVHVPLRDFKKLDRWREQVASDWRLGHVALRIAIRISHMVKNDRGYAWPSSEVLEKGICKRTALQNATRQLRECEHITVEETRGRGRSNHYYLRFWQGSDVR